MTDNLFVQELRQYLAAVHKRRWLAGACVSLSLVLATLYNYTTRPVYRATAQLLIDRDLPRVLPTRLVGGELGSADYYQTQYQLLRGRSLAERVVQRLELAGHPELRTSARLNPWRRLRWSMGSKEQAQAALSDSRAAAALLARLSVQPLAGSRLVSVSFDAFDPELAARVVNTLALLYIEQTLEFRYTASREATGWLTERAEAQRAKLKQAERRLQEMREREGLVNLEQRRGIARQKLAALSASVVAARTERIGRQTVFEQMRALPPEERATFPLARQSAVAQRLRSELAERWQEETRLGETYGPKHPEMLRVRREIGRAREQLASEAQSVLLSAEASYRTALGQERRLEQSLGEAKREARAFDHTAVQDGVLKREVESHRQLLQELVNRTQETGLETELKVTNIRIVEKAEPPRASILPKRVRNYQLALLLGLVAGVGLAILFERLDNSVKTPEDIKDALGLPFLGMVPEDPGALESSPEPVVVRDPQAPLAEAYRVLRTNLIFSSADGAGRVLLFTSPNPGEGKTTTVANLAASLADNDARVLAVGADLRKPRLYHHFDVERAPGLSDAIVGKVEPTRAVRHTKVSGLQIVPCGYVPPNPTELLGSASLRDIIAEWRRRYDWVLIDAPPALAIADAAVLCARVDGVVLVVRAETCPRPAVQRAVDQLGAVGGKIVGVVLNGVDLSRNSYYYSQYYGEYFRSYYGERPRAASSHG